MTDSLLSQTVSSSSDATASIPGPEVESSTGAEIAAQARTLAARGTVLLRNDGALPLAEGTRVALFGRVQRDWIAVGYGSGGDVHAPYVTNLLDELRDRPEVTVDPVLAERYDSWCREHPVEQGTWGNWPRHHPEMPIGDEEIASAATRNDVAVLVIGRAAGEDREMVLEAGSYYLTAEEERLLGSVTTAFDRTIVVLDAGNVIDLGWSESRGIDAVLLAWCGGMESGRALADVLTGAAEPGGRLTTAIAREYADYPSVDCFGDPVANSYVEDVFVGYRYFETFAPDRVLYPFGHGLSYTRFQLDPSPVLERDGTLAWRVTVTNTGRRPGSEVVQVYAELPDGALSHPARSLVAYARTGTLDPGGSTTLELSAELADLAGYDDAGRTGHPHAWVLEPGRYRFHIGADSRRTREAGDLELAELRIVRAGEEAAALRPEHGFDRMVLRRDAEGRARVGHEPAPTASVDLPSRIRERLPAPLPPVAEHGPDPTFADVLSGRATVEEFVARLGTEELAALAHGDLIMDSPLGPDGNAGVLGGVSPPLRDRGVPPLTTTDGPSGIRLAATAALLPCGTALASTWDPEAVRELAALHAAEMIRLGSDVLLSPGMNIQRNPLGGRNFEYFSEDPLLTGTMAAAVVAGLQSRGVAACPKHFAVNSQETARTTTDSRLSERALREIYLRGFEICIRRAAPHALMTSYNKINGVWGHYHYDLVTTILRGEWGYDGSVLTDWWMQLAPDPDFPALRDSAYRVRAQVDVLMPGAAVHFGDVRDEGILESHARPDGLTRGEMQRTAVNVIRHLLRRERARTRSTAERESR